MKLSRKPETFEVIKFEVKSDEPIPYGTAPAGFMLISGAHGPQGFVGPGVLVNPGEYVLIGDRGTRMVVTQAELDEMAKGEEWGEVKDKDEHPVAQKAPEPPPRPTSAPRA